MTGEIVRPITPTNVKSEARTMSFPDAMQQVINGNKIRRISWGNLPDYCLLKDGWLSIWRNGAFHPWNVNDGDMEGQDWIVVPQL